MTIIFKSVINISGSLMLKSYSYTIFCHLDLGILIQQYCSKVCSKYLVFLIQYYWADFGGFPLKNRRHSWRGWGGIIRLWLLSQRFPYTAATATTATTVTAATTDTAGGATVYIAQICTLQCEEPR